MSFAELGLSEAILQAVSDTGYRHPTPIQAQAIPVVLQGRDVLGCAQTGTGKTAAFTLPMIDILAAGQPKARMPRSLILEPTRELAAQVAENFATYGKQHNLTVALLIGGVRMEEQNALIDRGVDVLIATPGRLLDHAQNGKLLLTGIKILVIDEADRMLDMGFIPDVEKIVDLTPPLRQTLFFSATMPPEIRRLADRFLHNPKEIAVAPPASPAETVDQSLALVHERDKRQALRALLASHNVSSALIFCNRKKDIGVLTRSLQRHGFKAEALHGDMSQPARTETLERFRRGEFGLLVCSDVAARGLDIQGLPFVFLFDVPMHPEDYVHRIGRTGRAGMVGRSITLATHDDAKFLAAIERLIRKPIDRIAVPGLANEAKPGVPAMAAPVPVGAETPSGQDDRRGRRRGRRRDRDPRERDSRPPRTEDRSRRNREPEPAVVGLGDHVPAFLLKSINLKKRPEEPEEKEPVDEMADD
ncbi:MAG: DEAD/DEAH box helicase [Alphaproteobacteria bacterium]|nr:DEAD/DEAH box helicase [Alphaproteobacteria bacterium]